jgi:hypothetical protein
MFKTLVKILFIFIFSLFLSDVSLADTPPNPEVIYGPELPENFDRNPAPAKTGSNSQNCSCKIEYAGAIFKERLFCKKDYEDDFDILIPENVSGETFNKEPFIVSNLMAVNQCGPLLDSEISRLLLDEYQPYNFNLTNEAYSITDQSTCEKLAGKSFGFDVSFDKTVFDRYRLNNLYHLIDAEEFIGTYSVKINSCVFKEIKAEASIKKEEKYKEVPYSVPLGLGGTGGDLNPFGESLTLAELIGRGVKIILSILGTLAFMIFIYGGLLYMVDLGGGDRKKKGLQTLIWAAIGLVIIFASYGFVSFIFQAYK